MKIQDLKKEASVQRDEQMNSILKKLTEKEETVLKLEQMISNHEKEKEKALFIVKTEHEQQMTLLKLQMSANKPSTLLPSKNESIFRKKCENLQNLVVEYKEKVKQLEEEITDLKQHNEFLAKQNQLNMNSAMNKDNVQSALSSCISTPLHLSPAGINFIFQSTDSDICQRKKSSCFPIDNDFVKSCNIAQKKAVKSLSVEEQKEKVVGKMHIQEESNDGDVISEVKDAAKLVKERKNNGEKLAEKNSKQEKPLEKENNEQSKLAERNGNMEKMSMKQDNSEGKKSSEEKNTVQSSSSRKSLLEEHRPSEVILEEKIEIVTESSGKMTELEEKLSGKVSQSEKQSEKKNISKTDERKKQNSVLDIEALMEVKSFKRLFKENVKSVVPKMPVKRKKLFDFEKTNLYSG